ncbi:uncharacterized protein [Littorina saxatilis]|uniref:Uncharacterized protein n=1 Tax=Littorina saxatilis TaxID=31220 RepID=A0AAN9BH38_9CAEN
MDPFSIRLRKQRERSSLHARQLNKNAMTMLRRQLNALEKNEQQNARTLRRTKQAILEEIEASKDIEHEGLERRQNNPPRPRTLPSLATDDPPPREMTVVPAQNLVPENYGFYQHKAGSSNVQFALKGSANHSQVFSASERGRSAMRVRHVNGNTEQEDTCGDLSCRFRALSPLSPCRYFPCRRPQSYHRLGVSDVDVTSDPIPLEGGSEGGVDEPMLSPRSQVSSGSLQSNSTHVLS